MLHFSWQKLGVLVISIAGILAIFYFSWFWRLLLIPVVLVALWDVASSLFSKR